KITLDKIERNRYQSMVIFNEEKILELQQSINTNGMIQQIVVQKLEDETYEIIAGERRWSAVQELGWESIPSIIRDLTDTQTATVALIENLQREELTVIEEATAYKQLIN